MDPETPTTPVQPAPAPVQPAVGTPAPTDAGTDWKARYDGLVRKVEELTLRGRDLEGQLVTKNSETEQLRVQLTVKDAEKSAAVGERDTRINTFVTEASQMQSDLDRLRALELKLKVANDLGRPELMKIADRIPAVTDEEALKTIMGDFANFVDTAVQQREQQLMAGITPGYAPPTASSAAPQSEEGWLQRIEGLPLGSPERGRALTDYGAFLEQKHQR